MTVADNTPIIVGVGQFTERIDSPEYQGLSPVDIAAKAAERALADTGGAQGLRGAIDVIATTRTFEDSGPSPAVFGKTDNFPRSIARRLGIDPRYAFWEKAGGNTPQQLVSRFCGELAAGTAQAALLAGAEAISTLRHLSSQGQKRNWAEHVEGQVEDGGWGLKGMVTYYNARHRIIGAPEGYALLENARRGRLGMTRDAYAREMGRLFAPFSHIAAANPYSCSAASGYTVDDLITVTERNRMIVDPYPQRLVAKDAVNQGAAVVLTTVGRARQLGIVESKWVYLHGYAVLSEREIMERQDLGASPAARLATTAALEAAGIGADDIEYFDFYSCFPIPVFNVACDELRLPPDDPRGLTVTGGLPYFGGPGNNYSMHAIAAIVAKLRANPGSYGFVGANGGWMSKYAAGVYSTRPVPWKVCDSGALQARIDALPAPVVLQEADGEATIESYTIVYQRGQPAYALIVGRLAAGNERFLALSQDGDGETLARMLKEEPLGQRVHVRSFGVGNRFTFTAARMNELFPPGPKEFRERYEYCLVERRDHLLEVTINRPESHNSLHPMAGEELAEIFDAYEDDDDLWVAILTGAGTEAFCSGNDLKYSASGKPVWIPKSGFGGVTRRRRVKPLIAAVNGIAMGGGTEIALACDLVVADDKAVFALSEVRVGLFAGAGGIVRLPRQIPKKVAMEMILTGRRAGAEEMCGWGLVNRVVPAGTALEAARRLAEEILEGSPTSVRLSMEVMNHAERIPAEVEAVPFPPHIIDALITSEDGFEGPMAFAQKRKPNWKNR
ncbi:acetyl-CoA acetyltransferase [Steroidobacter denitrificans]|uniref:Acetyl-CoA acetyltransferase n=1 Tax=Steroidobacter denitrificans TaxID=465721 RepID=A0A127FAW8_STEDE|nr:acetyl-CoA acetyltransferase [Steroidobacter denitrificans]AMN47563.1 acetyl-CoA acetyltransferase [Steroidobacter denitrificans]